MCGMVNHHKITLKQLVLFMSVLYIWIGAGCIWIVFWIVFWIYVNIHSRKDKYSVKLYLPVWAWKLMKLPFKKVSSKPTSESILGTVQIQSYSRYKLSYEYSLQYFSARCQQDLTFNSIYVIIRSCTECIKTEFSKLFQHLRSNNQPTSILTNTYTSVLS